MNNDREESTGYPYTDFDRSCLIANDFEGWQPSREPTPLDKTCFFAPSSTPSQSPATSEDTHDITTLLSRLPQILPDVLSSDNMGGIYSTAETDRTPISSDAQSVDSQQSATYKMDGQKVKQSRNPPPLLNNAPDAVLETVSSTLFSVCLTEPLMTKFSQPIRHDESQIEKNAAAHSASLDTETSPLDALHISGGRVGIRPVVDTEAMTTVSCSASVSQTLPAEIIHLIYYHLCPVDYNSARHTCRVWYIHSLEMALLEKMIQRGGWEASINAYFNKFEAVSSNCPEWILSKIIARECAFSPAWKGIGWSQGSSGQTSGHMQSPFQQVAHWEFAGSTEDQDIMQSFQQSGIFTISMCGRFLMVARGSVLFIYRFYQQSGKVDSKAEPNEGFGGDRLHPVSCIICPRKIITCSMDTSSQRYAVAVLMEDRMGLVSNITAQVLHSSETRCAGKVNISNSVGNLSLEATQDLRAYVSAAESSTKNRRQQATLDAVCCQNGRSGTRSIKHMFIQFRNPSCPGTPTQIEYGNDSGMGGFLAGMPREESQPMIFHSLCISNDPPQSVAICPQRQCVAFGCRSGIELHWVDALTGQNLNRWFPLNSSSDFLHFLPPKKASDSGKRLRLISSSARPRTDSGRKFASALTRAEWVDHYQAIDTPNLASAGGNGLTFSGQFWHDETYSRRVIAGSSSRTADDSDHYHAVPLSDGVHILFTDPGTGLLCLGSDAPLGGPTKLFRKFWFKGPDDDWSAPVLYTPGHDLTLGIRILAVFESVDSSEGQSKQSIWLYSIPRSTYDIESIKNIRKPYGSRSPYPESVSMNSSTLRPSKDKGTCRRADIFEWMRWWPDNSLQEWLEQCEDHEDIKSRCKSPWPIQVVGQKVGDCQGIVDVTIDSGSSKMTIWAFSRDGNAKVWQVNEENHGCIKRHFVVDDGTIRLEDGSGDIQMPDAAPPPSTGTKKHFQEDSFDGAASPIRETQVLENKDLHGTAVLADEDGQDESESVVGLGPSFVFSTHTQEGPYRAETSI